MPHAASASASRHADPVVDPLHKAPLRRALRATPMFHGLDDAVLDRLAAISTMAQVTDGTEVCRQGDMATHWVIVLDGQLATSNTTANGTVAVIEDVRPGGSVGLATLLARLPLLLGARAVGPTRLLSVEAKGLLALMQQEPSLVCALLRVEADLFRSLVRQVCDLKLRTTAQRLGCYLLSLSEERTANATALRLPFDKRLLAARLGCRQENLSRAFAALRGLGVETHGARVILHDIAGLRTFALPDDPFDEVAA